MTRRWGYKPGGETCLFEIENGVPLPAGWSEDHMVITEPAKRTAEAITASAGTTAEHPVRVEGKLEDHSLDFRASARQDASDDRRGPMRPLSKDKI